MASGGIHHSCHFASGKIFSLFKFFIVFLNLFKNPYWSHGLIMRISLVIPVFYSALCGEQLGIYVLILLKTIVLCSLRAYWLGSGHLLPGFMGQGVWGKMEKVWLKKRLKFLKSLITDNAKTFNLIVASNGVDNW